MKGGCILDPPYMRGEGEGELVRPKCAVLKIGKEVLRKVRGTKMGN